MRIQIMKIFSLSFQNVWRHMVEWFRVAYAPLVILVVGLLFLGFTYWYVGYPLDLKQILMGNVNSFMEANGTQPQPQSQLPPQPLVRVGQSVYFITHLIFGISIYINNIRYGVLHEGGRKWWTLNLNWRFLKMVLYALLLGILGGAYVLVSIGIGVGAHYLFASIPVDVILGAVFFIYGLYLLFRVSLYGVLIALDKPKPIRTSWSLLKGNVLRLVGLYFLLILALLALTSLGFLALGALSMIPSLASLELVSTVLFGLFAFFMFEFIFLAVTAKASSLVYQTVAEVRAL